MCLRRGFTEMGKFDRAKKIVWVVERMVAWLPKWSLGLLGRAFSNGESDLAAFARYLWLRRTAASCGTGVFIGPQVEFKYPARLILGKDVSIHRWCFIDAGGGLKIGDYVAIAHSVSLISVSHSFTDPNVPIKKQPTRKGQIVIGNDVWVGAGARVLCGVHVCDRVVIGANSVVSKDIVVSGVYVGAPAQMIRPL